MTTELRPFSAAPNSFHQLDGRISAVAYPICPLFGKTVLRYEEAFHHANLEVYSLRVGTVDGVVAGYLFRSPLAVKCDPYFVLFYRRGVNVVQDIIKRPQPAEKKYVFSSLVVHQHDQGYLLTRLEENGVTKMLAN